MRVIPPLKPSLVIMLDLNMPGQVDGEELLFQLRDQSYEIPKQPDQRTALRMRARELKQLGWKL